MSSPRFGAGVTPVAPDPTRRSLALRAALAFAWASAVMRAARGEASIPPGWSTIAVGRILTLQAPAGTRFLQQAGTDSFVGTLAGPGFALDLDYGAFSDPLADLSGLQHSAVAETRIGGQPTRIVTGIAVRQADGGRYFIGVHVTALQVAGSRPISLTISGQVQGPQQQQLVRQMLATIRFSRTR